MCEGDQARCSSLSSYPGGAVLKRIVLCSSVAFCAFACNRSADSNQDSTQVAESARTPNPDAPIMVRGTVGLTQPFHLYVRAPSDLSRVKEGSFVGVTSVKQPDGSERATEIHVFPEELRGVGEGSRMMAPDTSARAKRMTNGNVLPSRMTNGTASQSRMSNGNVSSTNGTSLVVQYAGGSQNVTVPPNTPVTELKLASRGLAVGDQVAVVAKRSPDGSLTADKAISTAR